MREQVTILFLALKQLHQQIRAEMLAMQRQTSQQFSETIECVVGQIKTFENQIIDKNLQIRELELKIK